MLLDPDPQEKGESALITAWPGNRTESWQHKLHGSIYRFTLLYPGKSVRISIKFALHKMLDLHLQIWYSLIFLLPSLKSEKWCKISTAYSQILCKIWKPCARHRIESFLMFKYNVILGTMTIDQYAERTLCICIVQPRYKVKNKITCCR